MTRHVNDQYENNRIALHSIQQDDRHRRRVLAFAKSASAFVAIARCAPRVRSPPWLLRHGRCETHLRGGGLEWGGHRRRTPRAPRRRRSGASRRALHCGGLLVVGVIGHSLFVAIAAVIATVLALVSVLAALRGRFAAHRIGRRREDHYSRRTRASSQIWRSRPYLRVKIAKEVA